MPPKLDRNRRMLADFEAGHSLEQVGGAHGLTRARVRAILTDEKNRRSLSPASFYRSLRAAAPSPS
jgi:DNA-directed RNA polymerase sigma subunit (sigma70/sigma32)